MREIKFRAWNIKNKEMLQNVSTGTVRIWDEKSGKEALSDECILMQYTGLEDKNGKEIYEGDILTKNPLYKYRVIWKNSWGRYMLTGIFVQNKRPILMNMRPVSKMEILGNVYENPELIN